MKRRFNDTGICIKARHYMVDVTPRLDYAVELIESGEYFCISRPRQYGKTTLLSALTRHLESRPTEYLFARISFEALGEQAFETEGSAGTKFLELVLRSFKISYGEEVTSKLRTTSVADFQELSAVISDFVRSVDQHVVIMIDEVDRAGSYNMFLRFLGTLRTKYLDAHDGRDATFQSVVLAGLHDIKSLKLKIRDGANPEFNSPWNIASDFKVRMSFEPPEIAAMLDDYCDDRDVRMDTAEIAEAIYYYTSGHPFLVSKMCKEIDETFERHDQWTTDDIDAAYRYLIDDSYTNTNFDDLAKTLYCYDGLYEFVQRVLFSNGNVHASSKDPIASLALQYGYVVNTPNGAAIHNRIYEAIILSLMTTRMLRERDKHPFPNTDDGDHYNDDGDLDVRHVLRNYQRFMKEHQSDRDRDFIEREGRLIFLAFLQPVLNGCGHCFKEAVVGNERRMDLVVTFNEQREVIELKVWRGRKYHQRGLEQLAAYLEQNSLDHGYLLIYDFRSDKEYKEEEIEFEGKRIFAIWV